jgi:Cu/Ag efflux pump CusA
MQQPLAVAIIAGLAVQLPLVLLAMPALYLLIEGLAARLARRGPGRRAPPRGAT